MNIIPKPSQSPLWKYLSQLIGDPARVAAQYRANPIILNPVRFWRCQRRSFLKRCLDQQESPNRNI